MGEVFRTKVRNVGTSLGVLIPREVAGKENVRVGDDVEINIVRLLSKKEREKIIKQAFGMAKRMGGKPLKFERDRKDHDFSDIG